MATLDGHDRTAPPKRMSLTVRAIPPTGQYSVQKFLALHDYLARACPWRAAFMIVSTPLPGLVAALLPAFLPVRPLREGATVFFYANVFLVVVFATIGTVLPALFVTDVPRSVYSFREAVLVALCCGAMLLVCTFVLTTLGGFPIPFFLVVATFFWLISAAIAHVLVLGRKCWSEPALARAVRHYGLGLLLQVMQVVVYPAVSVLFDHVNGNYQVAITLLFPVIKIAMKRSLKYATRKLRDQHGVVVICAVEICSSLYQSMIMQTAPSMVAMIVIMALDLVQGFFSVKVFLDRPCEVPRRQLVTEALQLVCSNRLHPTASKSKLFTARSASVTPAAAVYTSETRSRSPKDILHTRANLHLTTRRRIVRQALQLTHVAETLLLVEYFEVIVPLVNCTFLIIAVQLRSAFYNTKMQALYGHPTRLHDAIASILLYALLQGLSCVAMHFIMKHRYGLSATYHLAFVLEHHGAAIQFKMVAWLPVILHFTSAHYGTDFSFRFDFKEWEQW